MKLFYSDEPEKPLFQPLFPMPPEKFEVQARFPIPPKFKISKIEQPVTV
jgi:hypothetical protein